MKKIIIILLFSVNLFAQQELLNKLRTCLSNVVKEFPDDKQVQTEMESLNSANKQRAKPTLKTFILAFSKILTDARGVGDKQWVPKFEEVKKKMKELEQTINELKNKIENKDLTQIKQSRKELENIAKKAHDLIFARNNILDGIKHVFQRVHSKTNLGWEAEIKFDTRKKLADVGVDLKCVIADLQRIQK